MMTMPFFQSAHTNGENQKGSPVLTSYECTLVNLTCIIDRLGQDFMPWERFDGDSLRTGGTDIVWMGSWPKGGTSQEKDRQKETLFFAFASSSLLLWTPRTADLKTERDIWDLYSCHFQIIPSFYVWFFLCTLSKQISSPCPSNRITS